MIKAVTLLRGIMENIKIEIPIIFLDRKIHHNHGVTPSPQPQFLHPPPHMIPRWCVFVLRARDGSVLTKLY